MLNGKTVLITGGTGSFGKKCTEIIYKRFKPKKVIIFSRDELKQYEMSLVFPKSKYDSIRYFLGDIRDKDRLARAFHGVDYVIHAAAMKQVPAAEYNPFEAVKTNIIGAQNIIDVAIDQKVSKVLALSTDKAANPINLYGATKLCSDKLFIAGNSYVGEEHSTYSVVRYGNVVGSRGSVIPFFREEMKKGELPITDPRMTRFWITLDQGVDFVLDCMERMVGGELFVPKLPSMNIMDLAEAVAPGCKTRTTGIRPGEKLHEIMISADDSRRALEFPDYYLLTPEFEFFTKRFKTQGGKPVEEDFEYSSKTNSSWLTMEQLREMIGQE